MGDDEDTDATEAAFENGQRMAWTSMLALCLKNLGYDSDDAGRTRWILEREGAISQLRTLCAEFGDNEWPNDLHLADVISKHLGDRLRAPAA